MLVNSKNINHLSWLKAVFTEDDIRMFVQTCGEYIPTAGVLSQREEGRQRLEIDSLGKAMLGEDYVAEGMSKGRVWIGMKGERGSIRSFRNEDIVTLSKALRRNGYKVRCQTYKGRKSLYVYHNQTLMANAAKVHPLYVAWLRKNY